MNSQTTFISFETVERSSHTAPRIRISYQALSRIAGLIDGVAIAVAAVAGDAIYQNLFLYRGNVADLAAGSGLIAACIYVLLARSFGLYRLPALLMPGQILGKLVTTWALSLLVMTAILFLLKVGSTQSRGSFLTFAETEARHDMGAEPPGDDSDSVSAEGWLDPIGRFVPYLCVF